MGGGTKVADVYIGINGDLTQWKKDVAAAGQEAKLSLGQQIRAGLAGGEATGTSPLNNLITTIQNDRRLGASLRTAVGDAFKGGAASGIFNELTSAFRGQLGNTVKAFGSDVVSIGGSAFRGVGNIAMGIFGGLKSAAGDIFKGVEQGLGIGAFLGLEEVITKLVQTIPDLINKGETYAKSVQIVGLATGATTEQSSKLLGTYTLLGGTQNDLITKVDRLAVTLKTRAKDFEAYGVAVKDSNGNDLNQIQILNNLREVLSTLPDGYRKTQLELLAFGRNGATSLGPLLNYLHLSNQQIADISANLQSQNLILDDSAVKLGAAYARATANIGNAFTGLGVTIFQVVGPEIISFFDGLAKDLTAHAKEIGNVFGSVVTYVIGLVQGLAGITLPLNSFSTQLTTLGTQGNDYASQVVDLTAKIAKEQTAFDKLKAPLGDTTSGFRDQTQALKDETTAVDAQIKSWNDIGVAATKALAEELAGLTSVVDKQLASLALADKLDARAKAAASLQKQGEAAADALVKAKEAQQKAEIGIAQAQAQYNKDLANPNSDPATQADTIAKNTLAIAAAQQAYRDATQGVADAQQGIVDNQQAVSDNTQKNAEDDRKAKLEGIKAYIADVAKIVADGDNKTATLKTLHAREDKVRSEIAADQAKGDAQAVADDEIRLRALVVAAHDVAVGKKVAKAVDELTAKKALLAEEIQAVQNAQAAQTASVKSAALDQFNAKKEAAAKTIAADKAALVQAQENAAKQKTWDDELRARLRLYGEDAQHTLGSGGLVPTAYTDSQIAGQNAADGIKKAFGSLIDLLLGGQLQGPAKGGGHLGRTGGLVGALQDVAGFIGDIAGAASNLNGALDAATTGDARQKILLVTAGWAALSGNWPLAAVLLATAGIVTGFDVVANVNSKVQANPSGAADFALGATGGATQAGADTRARLEIHRLQGLPPGALDDSSRSGETNAQALARLTAELAAGVFTNGGFAGGGRTGAAPQIAWLAERGQEYVISNETLHALDQLGTPSFAAIGGADRGREIHVHVQVPWSTQSVDFISREMAYRRR